MNETRAQRRLAAILAADVAGYSRMMGADEAGTLAALRDMWSTLFNPSVTGYRGRIVKKMGDGALVEFASAVDAVECALAIQVAMAAFNTSREGRAPVELRMGVNLGDIVIEGDDIFGDGVNVAARLEAQAPRTGILISDSVHAQIRGKVGTAFTDAGELSLKNIEAPVRAWRWGGGDATTAAAGAAPKAPDASPSIAVLPFNNISGDPEQEYFSDGITEDIITDLSKISGLLVIARNSSFAYKGKTPDIRVVGRELGVTSVLEGSIRRAGNRVRITAQLIDAVSGGHLWAERFDRDLTDIFAVQDDVTQQIVAALALNLTEGDGERIASKYTDSLDAYDCFLRGREHWWRLTLEGNSQARELLQRAVKLDPKFATAYAFLAATHVLDYVNQWGPSGSHSLELAHEMASRAVALDDRNPYAQWSRSGVSLWMRQHDLAIEHARRSIALNPNFAEGHNHLGWVLHYAGMSEEALGCFDRAVALNPYFPDMWLHFKAMALFQLGRFESAIGILQRRLVRNPSTDVSRVLLAASYGHLGRIEEARAEWHEVFRINPHYSLEHRRNVLPYKNPDDFELVVEGLRKAGVV